MLKTFNINEFKKMNQINENEEFCYNSNKKLENDHFFINDDEMNEILYCRKLNDYDFEILVIIEKNVEIEYNEKLKDLEI